MNDCFNQVPSTLALFSEKEATNNSDCIILCCFTIIHIQEFCTEHLKWNQQYTLQKAANLLTQWVLRQPSLIRLQMVHSVRYAYVHVCSNPQTLIGYFYMHRIAKERIRHGVNYYEIEWTVDATVYQVSFQ